MAEMEKATGEERRMPARQMARIAAFAALAVVAAVIVRVGGNAVVPFSLVPLVALMAGMILGPRDGFLSMLVYVVLGLVGVPVFASPPFGGPAYVLKPTFGFLLGFIAAAGVTGLIAARGGKRLPVFVAAALAGLAVIYAVGLPYLYAILNFYLGKAVNWSGVLKIGFWPFIGFDIGKALLAAAVALAVMKRRGE